MAEASLAQTLRPTTIARRAPRGAARILIVEDEALIARGLACTLGDLGYVVAGVAHSAAQALRLAATSEPDLVLMDIRLPGGMDGIEAAAVLREAHNEVPVVFLSANTDSATMRRALTTCPGGYLSKPFDDRSVHTTIEVALSRHEREYALTAERDQLQRDSTTDALTGLLNRRCLDDSLKAEVSRARRGSESVGVVLLDLDHFKTLNDGFGHRAGDLALQSIAQVLRRELRQYDVAFRYGGEEFVVVVPGASHDVTFSLAERLRGAIASLTLFCEGQPLPRITASFGVAVFPEVADSELLRMADAAMYEAKRSGRDRVVAATPSPPARHDSQGRRGAEADGAACAAAPAGDRLQAREPSLRPPRSAVWRKT